MLYFVCLGSCERSNKEENVLEDSHYEELGVVPREQQIYTQIKYVIPDAAEDESK